MYSLGKPLHEHIREVIFDPLGMRDTYMSYRESPVAPDLAESHR